MDADALDRRMQVIPLFRSLGDETRRWLASRAVVRHFDADAYIWHAGAEAESADVILRGLVEIRRPTPGGEEALLALFGPRECIGLTAVLEQGRYPADAIALADVDLVRIPASDFFAAQARDPTFAAGLQRVLIDHSNALRHKIDVLSAGSVPRRLASLLLHLAERFGDEAADGTILIPVSLTRARLAQLVAARVETVIRTASAWQKKGWLRSTPEGFELPQPDALRQLRQGG